MKFHYGINNIEHLIELSEQVCIVLGYGSNGTADLLLTETAAAETQCGLYKDRTPNGAGFGLTQFDKIGFLDVQSRTRQKHASKITDKLGYNIYLVSLCDLNDDPLLALIFTRLKYKLIPDPIPLHLKGRADYWKEFFNTEAGKGTVGHYIESTIRHLREEEINA